MNNKMRILHTEWSDGLGGQERRVLSEAAGLLERGHYVAIACRQHARIKDEALRLGIDVHVLPFKKLYDIASIIRLTGLLREEKFDVVNTHSGVDSWIGGIAAKFAGIPLLVRTRHLNLPLRRNPLNFIHYLPDMYITCGEDMRSNLVSRCGFPGDRVVSIPTGISIKRFNVKRDKKAGLKYGLDADCPVITNVGILRSVKGHEVTLKAVKTVVESVPDARFLIVGDGPRKEALENMAAGLGISGHVIFTGFVEDIPGIYSFSDVAVLTSWSEGLPQSLLQAMAAGVPVIATRVGGVPEVVIHGRTGMLVEPGDHKALAEGIIKILNDPGLSMQLAGNARDTIVNEHSVTHMIDKIEGLYERLLRQKKGAEYR
ncbi:MAG: glycosyltransferase family 4 protein [Deferribacteres bacterium]|nr:glycosyltransferase family 4 protein [Deferribacteres bacterium]